MSSKMKVITLMACVACGLQLNLHHWGLAMAAIFLAIVIAMLEHTQGKA